MYCYSYGIDYPTSLKHFQDMKKNQEICRKSNRVAKRQEVELYWLIHNFPQGVDYIDSCDNTESKIKSVSPTTKDKGLMPSVKKQLFEGNSAQIAMKMPRLLRSGKSFSQDKQMPHHDKNHFLDQLNSSADTSNNHEVVHKKCKRMDKNRLCEVQNNNYVPVKRSLSSLKHESVKWKCESAIYLPSVDKTPSEDEIDLTPDEKIQKEKVEQLKQPKFQSEPSEICTRSGAYYAFSWKSPSCGGLIKQNSSQPTIDESVCKNKDANLSSNIVTRSSSRQPLVRVNQDSNITPLFPKEDTISVETGGEGEIKDEVKEYKAVPKKVKVGQQSLVSSTSQFLSGNSNESFLPLAHEPDYLSRHKKSKRKRLSLLPEQKNEEDDFTSTWLDALNRNDILIPENSASCSESPASSVNSALSDKLPLTRRGRTASLNCRAVLSALIKTDPGLVPKPQNNSSAAYSINSSSSNRNVKTEGLHDTFFKIKVTSAYKQQVELVNNGYLSKVHDSTDSLKVHESTVLANVEKIKVTTNGWSWSGTYIWYYSFYCDTDVKTTRLYFGAMERDGVELRVGDSVALQTSEKENMKPFVGKIIAMWQDNLGEMMVTLCWFYRPSDLENIKLPYGTHELYLSKHTDDNSVATIQDKVHVLSFPEYCRYYAHLTEKSNGTHHKNKVSNIVPNTVKWRDQKIPLTAVQQNCIYFCKGVYDFRLKRTLKQQLYYTKYL